METNISTFKQSLKGLSKKEKIDIIEQEINYRGLSVFSRPMVGTPPEMLSKNEKNITHNSSSITNKLNTKKEEKSDKEELIKSEELGSLLNEIKSNVEAYESKTSRKKLIPFMYDRDLNWYFNPKNIPAQKDLLEPTVDFIEKKRKDLFETIDFLNLLEWHYDELQKQFEKPFDFIQHLRALPLNDEERYLLIAALLKWYGGIPIQNEHDKLYSIRRLVEKEFLSMFVNEDKLERNFCASNSSKQLKEAAAQLAAAMPNMKVSIGNEKQTDMSALFPVSNYIDKVEIDFEDLPHYVIDKGIIRKFEGNRFNKESEYYEWQNKLIEFLNSIPNNYRIKALSKGIEYGKKVLQYHFDKECNSRDNCVLNQSWERRIALAKDMFARAEKQIKETEESKRETPTEKNKEFTTARQVLAMHLIFEYMQLKETEIDKTDKAKFIEFLTGKDYKNIYDAVCNPFQTKQKKFRFEDLQYIRTYFEKLGFSEIVKAINNQLEKPR
ncbi:MAG: hypothetical protein ABJB05_06075 [Parafilimonas sp.]